MNASLINYLEKENFSDLDLNDIQKLLINEFYPSFTSKMVLLSKK